MSFIRKFLTITTALAGVMALVGLQLAWNLQSPRYLAGVAQQAGTSQALASVLPDYAASKLPDAKETKEVFSKNVTSADIDIALASLHTSIIDAYRGKTDTVEIDLSPIIRPVESSGYQIPPGTVFAQDSLQVGALASILRTANRLTVPIFICFVLGCGLVMLLGIKRGLIRSLRDIAFFMSVFLGGLFVASLAIPFLVESLIASSGLDAQLRQVVIGYIAALSKSAGHYYLLWAVILLVVGLLFSAITGARSRPKKVHRPKPPKNPEAW